MPKSKIALFNFAYHAHETWEDIARIAKDEPWGKNNIVLRLYLQANFEIAKSQNKVYEDKENGIAFWRAGWLMNMTSDPIWLLYQKNKKNAPFWYFGKTVAGDPPVAGISAADYVLRYSPPEFERDWGIHFNQTNIDHILTDDPNTDRLQKVFEGVFVGSVNKHLLFRAIYGEIQLKRKEETVLPQWYHGDYQFLMPLCLKEEGRVDLTAALTLEPTMKRYTVRTLLLPAYAYAYARAIMKSRSSFADWMMLSDSDLDVEQDTAEEEEI